MVLYAADCAVCQIEKPVDGDSHDRYVEAKLFLQKALIYEGLILEVP